MVIIQILEKTQESQVNHSNYWHTPPVLHGSESVGE